MGMLRTLIGSRLPRKYARFFDLPDQVPSFVLRPRAGTPVAAAAAGYTRSHGHASAVHRLDDGLAALSVRLGLIAEATSSIDIQSYLIKDDVAGNLIALALLDAAERGIRIRLLMDDALTDPIDSGLVALNRHSNVEVRVFNPFPRRRSRLVSLIANFNILNRRMHNKSFTVDASVSIVGGRNIADEYYQTGGRYEFVDEDLLAVGRVVDNVAAEFDRYWNTREAIPVTVFDEPDLELDVAGLRSEGQAFLAEHVGHHLLQSRDNPITLRWLAGELPMTAADVRLIADPPGKIRPLALKKAGATTHFLQKMVSSANEEVVIVSPYFVPQRPGVEFLAALVERGVRVVVVTNSLASTNHASVHAVYSRYRKPLLKNGVELYELTPGQHRAGSDQSTKLTLHSKIVVVDRGICFVGSFNMDPRSLYLNTEMGLAVRSSAFSSDLSVSLLEQLPDFTYRLRLDKKNRLNWEYGGRKQPVTWNREPDTTLWRRFRTRLMGFLPIEEQM